MTIIIPHRIIIKTEWVSIAAHKHSVFVILELYIKTDNNKKKQKSKKQKSVSTSGASAL